jgi:tRNA (cytidine32/uridine32-2'-O)-methyltransferase
LLDNIVIVLVETSHPGNIGAVARAMKNMCMKHLVLVSPKLFPCADATSRASGADDILASAVVCSTLQEAIADCQIVIGSSARCRTISWPEITPRECAEKLSLDARDNKVAIVFGRESSGLKNEELDLCQYLLRIPCNPDYSSLNLAAAVQVICYELFVASGQRYEVAIGDKGEIPLATADQMESYYEHLAQALSDIGFMHPDKSKTIMRRLRRVYNRIQLDTKELDILRGILKMAQGNKRNQ